MEYGQEFNVGPQLPRSSQPGSMPSVVPGEGGSPQNFGSLFGASGAPKMAAAPDQGAASPPDDQSQAPAEPTFGSLSERASPPTAPAPGQAKTYEQKADETSSQADRLVGEMRGNLKGHEEKAAQGVEDNENFDSFIAQMKKELGDNPHGEGEFSDETPRLFPGADPNAPLHQRVAQNVKYNLTKMFDSFGRNPQEKMNILKASFGEENVEMRNGEPYFRPGGKGKFIPFTEKRFAPFNKLILDNIGPIVEGATSTAVEALGLTGTAAAAAASGPAAPAVAVAGTVASAAAGGAAGATVRQAGLQIGEAALGTKLRDDEVSLVSESAYNTGLNLAVLGLGVVAKPAMAGLKKIVATFPENRIAALQGIRLGFDEFLRKSGVAPVLEGAGMRSAGQKTFDAIDHFGDGLQNAVTMVKGKAIELSEQQGREAVPTDNLLSKLKEHLEDRFVKFNKDGLAYIDKAATPVTEGGLSVADFATQSAQLSERGQVMHAYGAKSGDKTLELFVNQYNALLGSKNAKNGVPLQTLFDFVDNYSDLANYAVPKGEAAKYTPGEIASFRELRHAAESDRHLVLDGLFHGSGIPEEEIYRTAFDNYHGKIDDVLQFRSMMNQSDKAAAFAKSLIQPDGVETIQKLKGILGDGSPEWNSLRGEWLASMVDKSIWKSSGILNGNHFIENMKGMGKEVLNEMLTKEEQGTLNKMAVSASKIAYQDLLGPNDKDVLEYVMALSPLKQFETSRMKVLWSLVGKNKLAIDYLNDEALLKMASQAPDKATQTSFLRAKRYLGEMVSKMHVAEIERTNPKTGVKKTVQVYVPAGRQALNQAVQEVRRNQGAAPAATGDLIPTGGGDSMAPELE